MRYRVTLAYDGSAYQGFQRQREGVPTVQAAVEDALRIISGQQVPITAAGRTDTGVHATGQVIAFDLTWAHSDVSLMRAINANLPSDIAVQDVVQQPGFHPRFDALSRRYAYVVVGAAAPQPLMMRQAWVLLDVTLHFAAMQRAAGLLIGTQDFAAFGQPPQGTNTLRTVFASAWTQTPTACGLRLTYRIEATAFLQHMVRRIVGALVQVGRGSLSVSGFADLLHSRDVSRARWLAPPQGLILEHVRYHR